MAPAASPLHKPTTNNSTPNHVFLARHKSSKRGGGGSVGPTNNDGFAPPPAEAPLSAPDKPVAAATAEGPPGSSPRDPPHEIKKKKNDNWEAGPRAQVIHQSHVGNDMPQGPFWRGNGGPRGDGNYHGGYGNRCDHEWNQQVFNGRDVHARQPRALPRSFIRHPPPAPGPFVAPPPIRPYGGPMGFHELTAAPQLIAHVQRTASQGGLQIVSPRQTPLSCLVSWEDKKCKSESRFPAQVRIRVRKLCKALEEDALRPV